MEVKTFQHVHVLEKSRDFSFLSWTQTAFYYTRNSKNKKQSFLKMGLKHLEQELWAASVQVSTQRTSLLFWSLIKTSDFCLSSISGGGEMWEPQVWVPLKYNMSPHMHTHTHRKWIMSSRERMQEDYASPVSWFLPFSVALSIRSAGDGTVSGLCPVCSYSSPCWPHWVSVLQDHCHYRGFVQDMEGSSVAMSICNGLRWHTLTHKHPIEENELPAHWLTVNHTAD